MCGGGGGGDGGRGVCVGGSSYDTHAHSRTMPNLVDANMCYV